MRDNGDGSGISNSASRKAPGYMKERVCDGNMKKGSCDGNMKGRSCDRNNEKTGGENDEKMNDKKMNKKIGEKVSEEIWAVDFPSDEEREASIRRIVEEGLPSPRKLCLAVPELVRTVGVRNLFFGVEDCVFLAVLLTVLVSAGVMFCVASQPEMLTVLLFIVSPLFYMAIHLLTVWKEVMMRTHELLMTCRCSLKQLTTARMLIFGGMSLCCSTALSGGLSCLWPDGPGLLRLFSISFAALFLFAGLSLLAERRWPAPLSGLLVPAVWMALGLSLLLLGERARQLLDGISTMAFLLAGCGGATVYFSALKHYYFTPGEGALTYGC